ncbi:immunoglobulin lambda-1 light chain-like isoform X2 [Syngnathoides biaculeatus]|uniref:immunoglobulin lambda-1 light chain-like isoform X2 n=1 Tax=Syngnathoides biaculeatus TaxID=300417 RepID=UPI002ADDA23F|nr:immunoglobulin lambda-1 light chain-like isoform X2 [Syngnathoides biaculeatus]
MLTTFCLLIGALTYVDAAKVLTMTPGVQTVSVGQEVVLDCNIQRDDGNSVNFYKHIPGDAPQFILYYYRTYSSPTFGAGFSSSRFGAKTSSAVNYQLIIKQAEAGDSAEYYCNTWDGTASEAVFGGGTKLLVTSADLPAPVVTVFPPASSQLQSKEATLVCVATQSLPIADVTWLARGLPARGAVVTGPAVRQADRTYKISSYLTVETSDWDADAAYTCKVSLGSKSAESTINKSKCEI